MLEDSTITGTYCSGAVLLRLLVGIKSLWLLIGTNRIQHHYENASRYNIQAIHLFLKENKAEVLFHLSPPPSSFPWFDQPGFLAVPYPQRKPCWESFMKLNTLARLYRWCFKEYHKVLIKRHLKSSSGGFKWGLVLLGNILKNPEVFRFQPIK